MKKILLAMLAVGVLAACNNNNKQTKEENMIQELQLTQEWDKTFPKSDRVDHKKVTFTNLFGITLAADMYVPKNAEGRLAAIAVCGPFGAVKEQSSGLYAQTMAERGFVTLAFDPSFTGESGGEPRRIASPDINTEDYSAAVDFLSNCERVDPERIGVIGICGWGGFALNVAAVDPRIKATVASTMYELTRINEKGYFDQNDSEEARYQMRQMVARQRTEDFRTGEHPRAGGVVDPLPDDAPQFVKDYYDYYKTPRGYHERSGNSTDGWVTGGMMPMMNTRLLHYAGEIQSAVLIIHGEKAHSRYMGEDAFKLLKGENKELMIIPGATHCDLYDGGNGNYIPWDKLEEFFKTNLK
ncbi:MAG: alpha/beta hydrolase [Muribaculaceae bacterium]|nr:alpha/beta hydrolase [Muribaculaceae bacterium]